MHFKITSFVLIFSILYCESYATEKVKKDLTAKGIRKASDVNNNFHAPAMSNNDEGSINSIPQKMCIPAICPKIFRPICVSVNGLPLTAPTMCHYNDKVRCYKEILLPGEKMPVFRILHKGACNDNEPSILNAKTPRRPGAQRQQALNQNQRKF